MATPPNAALCAAVQELTLARLRALINLHRDRPHTNRDTIWSPSRWWYDRAYTIRHTLATTATQSMSGNTITLTLNYEIRNLS